MERLRHCRLLFLYRHNPPCCCAGVSSRCKFPEEKCLKRKIEKQLIHLFRNGIGNLRGFFFSRIVTVSRCLLHRFISVTRSSIQCLCVSYLLYLWHSLVCNSGRVEVTGIVAALTWSVVVESHPAPPPLQEQEHQVQWVGSAVCLPLGVGCLEFLHTHNSEWLKKKQKKKYTPFSTFSTIFMYFVPLWFLWQEGYILHPSSLWENYPHVHLR